MFRMTIMAAAIPITKIVGRMKFFLCAPTLLLLSALSSASFTSAQSCPIDPCATHDCEECDDTIIPAIDCLGMIDAYEGLAACLQGYSNAGYICITTVESGAFGSIDPNYTQAGTDKYDSNCPNCILLNIMMFTGQNCTMTGDPGADKIVLAAALLHELCHSKTLEACHNADGWGPTRQAFCDNEVLCHQVELDALSALIANGGPLSPQAIQQLTARIQNVTSSQNYFRNCNF